MQLFGKEKTLACMHRCKFWRKNNSNNFTAYLLCEFILK